MPRLRHSRHDDPVDETPDWAWTEDADMPSDEQIERQMLRDGYDHGRRSGDQPLSRESPLPLSAQQHDVLACLSFGVPPTEIGERLGLSLVAVKDSMRQVRRKTGARSSGEAFAILYRAGRIE